VKGNTVLGFTGSPFAEQAAGISADGVVSGNFVTGGRLGGAVQASVGSTVIGNSVRVGAFGAGLNVSCPSNVTDNTADSLSLRGDGCLNTNNVGIVVPPLP
jgi:hypothetical protein